MACGKVINSNNNKFFFM